MSYDGTKPAHRSNYFFSNGIAKHFPSDSTSIPYSFDGRNDSDVDLAARNNQTILSQQFSFCFDYKMKHAPFALFKHDIFKLEEIIKDKIDITASNTLRSTDDVSIASSLAHLFSYLNKNSIPSTIDARYIGLDSFWFSLEISKLLITHNKPNVICINEAGVKDCNNARLSAKKIMTYLFPDKSPYEL